LYQNENGTIFMDENCILFNLEDQSVSFSKTYDLPLMFAASFISVPSLPISSFLLEFEINCFLNRTKSPKKN